MAEPSYEELKARLAELEKQSPGRRTGQLDFRVGERAARVPGRKQGGRQTQAQRKICRGLGYLCRVNQRRLAHSALCRDVPCPVPVLPGVPQKCSFVGIFFRRKEVQI